MLAARRIAHQVTRPYGELFTVAEHEAVPREDEVELFLVVRMTVATDGCAGGKDRQIDEIARAVELARRGKATELDLALTVVRPNGFERHLIQVAPAEVLRRHLL